MLCAALLVVAVQMRRDAEAEGDTPAGKRLTGVTGQRQTISFGVDEHGRPRSLATRIWAQCPGWPEHRVDWGPIDAFPVIRWVYEPLRVSQKWSITYDNGDRGFFSTTLEGRSVGRRIEGSMRSVRRLERDGAEYMVCDSGHVPFVAGAGAKARLARVTPVRRPWTLYPAGPEHRSLRSLAQRGFVERVDDTCRRTHAEVQAAVRRARRGGWNYWREQRAYIRGHNAQMLALMRLGEPPKNKVTFRRWLGNSYKRVVFEQYQFDEIYRGDRAAAASLAAQRATLKARGNAAGLALGLSACVSNGPSGSPTS